MKCIDFDKEFKRVLAAWIRDHEKDFPNPDAMEEAALDVYADFLNTPADFLSGQTPGEYFSSFSDAGALVNWMEDYFKQRVPVPEMLLERIAQLGQESEGPLVRLLQKDRTPTDAKMCAMTLLSEIESLLPMELYIALQKDRTEKDELADKALEGLYGMGEAAKDKMRAALSSSNPTGQEALLTLLCNMDGDEELADIALRLFETCEEKTAVLADVLGKLGQEKALPALIRRAESVETSYLDYIELRNAIERLGGEAPKRTFDENDPAYEALRGMQ